MLLDKSLHILFLNILSDFISNTTIIHTWDVVEVYIYTRVSWNIHRMTKIIAWNLSKLGLFFKMCSLVSRTSPICDSVLLWYGVIISAHPGIYIYIYIVIHRQTVSFYQNSSVWLETLDARSRDRNPSNFTLDCVSDNSSTKRTTLAKGI